MKLSVLVGTIAGLFLISGSCSSQDSTGGNGDDLGGESEGGGKSDSTYYRTDEFVMGPFFPASTRFLDHRNGLFLEYVECR